MFAVWLLAQFWVFASYTPPSFDGAMNLQVSWSLSEGEGFRRTYADRDLFPHEIQTKYPFVLPAAAIFEVFGLGMFQAQLTNLLYLTGLIFVASWLLARRFGFAVAAIGAFLLLSTPGLAKFGLNGYGEIPGLFWAVLSLALFPWQAPSTARTISAGICLSLALCTKTIMVGCVAVFGLAFVVAILATPDSTRASKVRSLVILALACIAPVAFIECWRMLALGLEGYLKWWSSELSAIGKQAGTATGFGDTTSTWEKFSVHLGMLSKMFGLSQVFTLIWIFSPVVASFLALWQGRTRRHDAVLLCIIGAMALYFCWWLFVTPTQKAWHRRIMDGGLLLNLSWVYAAALVSEHLASSAGWRKLLRPVAVLACLAFGISFYRFDLKTAIQLNRDDVKFNKVLGLVKSLPRDARLYGIGWNSSPVISLLTERPLDDINDTIIGEIPASVPAYLIADTATFSSGAYTRLISMYGSRQLLPEGMGAQVFELDFNDLRLSAQPFTGPLPTQVDLTGSADYDHLFGFYGPENGGRWMSSDAAVELGYSMGNAVAISIYTPPMTRYVRNSLTITVAIDGCIAGSSSVASEGSHDLIVPIAAACLPQHPGPVSLRISTDNLVDSPITIDDRSLSLVMRRIGFMDCRNGQPCEWTSPDAPEVLGTSSTTLSKSAVADIVPRDHQGYSLRVEPNPVERCGSNSLAFDVDVSWDTPSSHESLDLQVAAAGEARVSWLVVEGSGRATASSWVREGTTFFLMDSSGNELASETVKVASCNSKVLSQSTGNP